MSPSVGQGIDTPALTASAQAAANLAEALRAKAEGPAYIDVFHFFVTT